MSDHRYYRHRFTILEVIVAITLLVTVLGLLFLSTGTVLTSWEQLERQSQTFQQVLALDRTLDSILSNIVPLTWQNEDLEAPSSTFIGDNESVVFPYMHAFNRLDDGAIRMCSLRVEESNLVAYYCERPPFPDSLESEKLRRSILAHNVDSVSFHYADLEDSDLEFVDDWEDRDYLPLAIMVHVKWLDGTQNNWLRRTAGTSYYERWGKWEQKDRI